MPLELLTFAPPLAVLLLLGPTASAQQVADCPPPPGGRIVCEAEQIARCDIRGGKVYGECQTPVAWTMTVSPRLVLRSFPFALAGLSVGFLGGRALEWQERTGRLVTTALLAGAVVASVTGFVMDRDLLAAIMFSLAAVGGALSVVSRSH